MKTIEQQLFDEGFAFDFFQAVRLLERMAPDRRAIGRSAPPGSEAVRFRVHQSLVTPASEIYELDRPSARIPVPQMTVTFMGLTGSLGTLPLHYTELLIRQQWAKGEERDALRDWLDMFNNRLIAMFYRAWEKYRFYIGYERDTRAQGKAFDPFTGSLFSLIGLRDAPLRGRLRIVRPTLNDEQEPVQRIAAIDDLALLHYSGLLSHRPRSALGLAAILGDYFGQTVKVIQFHGQWLVLTSDNQSRMGESNSELGVSVVIGERVWDVQSKIRLRLGPMRFSHFAEFLPDRAPVPHRKAFFLLCHLVRLYLGAELDFDVQLVLKAEDVPACKFTNEGMGPRLGWNTWAISGPMERDADDAVFECEEIVQLN